MTDLPLTFDLHWFGGQIVLSFVAGFVAGTVIRVGRQLIERL